MSILNELGLRRSPRTHRATTRTTGHTTTGRSRATTGRRTGLFGTKRKGGLFGTRRQDRTAGLKAALTNPNTTHSGRQHAKHELHMSGHSAHVPLHKKIERTLGIHQTSRSTRKANNSRRRAANRRY